MNSITCYLQTIQHLDTLISDRQYKTARVYISKISARETFTRDQLIEVLIRSALVSNKCKEHVKGESLARKGYNILVALERNGETELKMWKLMLQLGKSLLKQEKPAEGLVVLKEACDLINLPDSTRAEIHRRYAKSLVDHQKYDEAFPILEKALTLATDPNIKGKIYCLSARLRNEKGEYDLALKESALGLRIMNACRIYDLAIIDLLKRQEAIASAMASREKKTTN